MKQSINVEQQNQVIAWQPIATSSQQWGGYAIFTCAVVQCFLDVVLVVVVWMDAVIDVAMLIFSLDLYAIAPVRSHMSAQVIPVTFDDIKWILIEAAGCIKCTQCAAAAIKTCDSQQLIKAQPRICMYVCMYAYTIKVLTCKKLIISVDIVSGYTTESFTIKDINVYIEVA
jgi:hypothetical protein